MAQAESKADVLKKTADMLLMARHGLSALADLNDAELKRRGIYEVAVFGRSVTLVLQNMRTIDRTAFDAWYLPYEEEMRNDPLIQFFNKLRTTILKEGLAEPKAKSIIHLYGIDDPSQRGIDWDEVWKQLPRQPTENLPGYDEGVRAWNHKITKAEDGTYSEEYIPTPEFNPWTSIELHLPEPPTEHMGEGIPSQSMERLAELYIAYLDRLVNTAAGHFLD